MAVETKTICDWKGCSSPAQPVYINTGRTVDASGDSCDKGVVIDLCFVHARELLRDVLLTIGEYEREQVVESLEYLKPFKTTW